MAEVAFEKFALALEATRGTAVTPPTVIVPLEGAITPTGEYYRPAESRGVLAAVTRSARVREAAEWSAEGGLDVRFMPIVGNMGLQVVTSPTTPGGGTNSRLWTFVRSMTTNALKTATLYGGDPNVQVWQAAFALLQEIVIAADGTGTDGTTLSLSGVAAFPVQVSAPTYPAFAVAGVLSPMDFQVWLDTSSAIGTTALAGRVLSVTHTIPTGLTPKYIPAGPGGSRTISRAGVARTNPVTRVVMELVDDAQMTLFEDETAVKLRVRHNGPLIEGSLYEYVEVDGYGYLDFASWGDFEGTNRTVEFELVHQYDATLGSDIRVAVQNTLTALPS